MPPAVMGTVDKALSLLAHFTMQQPEIGLSALSRLAGYDKTTILRCMTALQRHGFVEQDSDTKRYRLGLAPVTLARIRERSFPMITVLQPHLDKLRDATNETAHATLLTNGKFMTALISEPDRATRVFMDASADLPLHATASGLVIAAHLSGDARGKMVAQARFEPFTDNTPASPQALEGLFAQARQRGIIRVESTYDADVIGTAVPFFDTAGQPSGAVAVASVASRFTPALARTIEHELLRAGHALTRAFGGTLPSTYPLPTSPLPESAR